MEWERVWLLSAVEGALPHRYTIESGSQAAMEEERRLFYVGMTRAKDMLLVSAPAHMLGQDAPISRFVRESGIWAPPPVLKRVERRGAAAPAPAAPLPPPLPAEDYAPGVICFHAKFGNGVIDRVDERAGLVEVLFGGQRKVLALAVCQTGQMLRVGNR
ncbi:MAG TPA: 3'-5' exonuclease [Symbiobacteriaceae bacterium]|nr:3'-5' exonuclease [Symbiobacteriaceae bacterium]